MAKLMVILAIVTAFCVDTTLKSVCSYNKRLEQKKTTIQKSKVSDLGTMTVRYDKVLDCKNMDKPFVYKKQMQTIMMMSKKIYDELVDQSIIEIREAPSLDELLEKKD